MSNPIKSQVDNYWFSHPKMIAAAVAAFTEGDTGALRAILNARFEDGARWSMIETTRMSPYVNQFIEMLILLGAFEDAEWRSTTGAGAPHGSPEYDQGTLPGMREDVRVPSVSARDATNDVRPVQLADNQNDSKRKVEFCDYVYFCLEARAGSISEVPEPKRRRIQAGDFVHDIDHCVLLAGHIGDHLMSTQFQPEADYKEATSDAT